MVGGLGARAFGTHDLPIPREPATLSLVPRTSTASRPQWEIPTDEMRLWVVAHELAGHTLFGAVHVRDAVADLVREHVGGLPAPTPRRSPSNWAASTRRRGDPMAAAAGPR